MGMSVNGPNCDSKNRFLHEKLAAFHISRLELKICHALELQNHRTVDIKKDQTEIIAGVKGMIISFLSKFIFGTEFMTSW